MAKVITMFDQYLFQLGCGHAVVLGRFQNAQSWTNCGKNTDLTATPFRERLVHDLDTATQIDLQEKDKGNTAVRA
ncbi:hypothetical protein SAMN05216573_10792 [Bradyrhizobium sp. Rc3b]|uniref:hypothetical protein n=1 Tax=Bradyrhizobium sp. Rc3b TaxID=1855322 RepID=UPI0008E9F781|nr:hypothetical protein [Bradyrhizobium sp. Rc3b]SFN02824.1 hypothetical protein SAMN05216573_10792 [Bradyrhizobium sp. Rc3b]